MLNQDQQLAADGFFKFLLSSDEELIISGPGGTGKTFLMGHLIDKILPEYFNTCTMLGIDPKYTNVVMTATTNKAAEVLSLATKKDTCTIHSLLNLKVIEDINSGRTLLQKTRNWKIIENTIIFIDECSMIDSDLYKIIHEGTKDCKIIYVGDRCQLAPVMEPISPIYLQNMPFYELTEPMRNKGSKDLQNICSELRNNVLTQSFSQLKEIPGVIDVLDINQLEDKIKEVFTDPIHKAKIVAYTNSRVLDYNEYIQKLRGNDQYTEGEFYVNNNATSLKDATGRERMLSVEEVVMIKKIYPEEKILLNDVVIECIPADIFSIRGKTFNRVNLPVDRNYIKKLSNFFARNKRWVEYFKLKTFLDIRPKDASTVHKAQGSTYDTVFIDLEDINKCTNSDMVRRLLYVAFTRAKKNIYLYGKLKEKYGGDILLQQ